MSDFVAYGVVYETNLRCDLCSDEVAVLRMYKLVLRRLVFSKEDAQRASDTLNA